MTAPAARLTGVRFALACLTPFLASLAWAAALVAGPGVSDPPAALLVGTGLLLTGLVAAVGMMLTGARWAWRMGLAATGSTLWLAALLPLTSLWALGLGLSALAGVSLLSPSLRSGIRRLPAAAGPPARAVVVPGILLFVPLGVGLAGWWSAGATELFTGLSAPVAALWYGRVLPGGLLAVRLVWPGLALAMAPLSDSWGALAAVVAALAVTILSWHPEVKTAFHPPIERGSAYPIPPELTPEAIRDQAGIDDKGRPRH